MIKKTPRVLRLLQFASAQTRPNVVIVITDDQGYGDLACHGNPVIKTPHLDKLHSESTVLTDYHVAPTCLPHPCCPSHRPLDQPHRSLAHHHGPLHDSRKRSHPRPAFLQRLRHRHVREMAPRRQLSLPSRRPRALKKSTAMAEVASAKPPTSGITLTSMAPTSTTGKSFRPKASAPTSSSKKPTSSSKPKPPPRNPSSPTSQPTPRTAPSIVLKNTWTFTRTKRTASPPSLA